MVTNIDRRIKETRAPEVVTATARRIARLQQAGAGRDTITSLLGSWKLLLSREEYCKFQDAFLDEIGDK